MSYDAGRPFRSAGPGHLQRHGDRELPALQTNGTYTNQPVPIDQEYSGLFPQYSNQNIGQPPTPTQYGILPPQTRHTHTCSADSPYAHPDEDWRNEPDLGRRRRVQNRVAQRKYRACKKEKERMGKPEKTSHGSTTGSTFDTSQDSLSKSGRFPNRSKIRFRDVVPNVEHSPSSLSPRVPNAPPQDFPRAIGQPPTAASYQVHYTSAPYQVNSPITASNTWPMAYSQPDLSAPMHTGPQMNGNGSATMNYMKHHHSPDENLSAYHRGNGQSSNYSDQNAHELSLEQLPAFTTSPSLSVNDVGPETPEQDGPSPQFPSMYSQGKRSYDNNPYLRLHGA